ncbi:MAG: DnaA/Hda family protein [Myxococcota bacterium]
MTFSPKVWGDALRRLQKDIPDFAFEAWIEPLQVKLNDDSIVLGCPSSFHCDRVRMHHAEAIQEIIQELTGRRPHLEILPLSKFAQASGRTFSSSSNTGAFADHDVQAQEEEAALRAELRTPLRVVAGQQAQTQALASGDTKGVSAFRASPGTQVSSSTSGSVSSSASAPASPFAAAPPFAAASALRVEGATASGSSASKGPSSESSGARAETGHLAKRIPSKQPPSERPDGESQMISSKNASKGFDPSRGEAPRLQSRAQKRPLSQNSELGLSLDGAAPAQGELPFSFESFVVGPCNSLAREAALALARQRQRSLNQIYLGGEAGMGKTHLSRATAIEARRHLNLGELTSGGAHTNARVQANAPRANTAHAQTGRPGIVYTTAEQFTSEFVSAMRHGRSDEFKKRYRGPIGLLIVEDVQSFEGRAKTQLELFNTIEHVLDAGGRVMLTGDRSPRDFGGLDARMREQLSRGFVAELEAPDALVRRHLLRSKAAAGGVHLPEDCLDLLVESTEGSVRDIESVLIQVVTTSSLLGRAIDLDLTREAVALKSGASSTLAPKTIAVSEIVRIVAAFFGKRPEALASRSRRRDVLVPRQLAMYLAHRYTEASLTEIGKGLGRDHPAVRNAVKRVERLVLENAPMRYQVEALSERIDQTLKNQAEDATR